MGLVKYALKFRATFYVLALLITVLGAAAIVRMPKDVFPAVDIPVVSVIWTYQGLSAEEMEKRVTTFTEFSLSNNVNGIKNIESQTLQGVAVEKVYFQPDVNIDLAIAQTVSAMNSIRAQLPPGINPPIIVRFSASSVPVIQMALSGEKQSEQQLYDYGQYRLRQTLITAPGSTIPSPYGGRQRQIMVDIDLPALQARGLTPADVTNAVTAQNVTVPSGLAKLGSLQYVVRLNSSPEEVETFNRIPVRTVNGVPVLMRDVANVRDGSPVQQNVVRVDGERAALLTILKNGTASTLSVVDNIKAKLEQARAEAPEGLKIKPLFDQSVFVSNAIDDVLHEGLIAAGLTGLMILLFLGSWRSTLIVLVSIPLAVLTSIAILAALGQTLNIMTLGGLALAVGILVDDATVAIENTYRLLEEGKPFKEAVVEGAAGIAKPTLVSSLTICAAFVSVFFLTDAAAYLFTPQAMAVVFAVLASYGLSRTLVPILVDVLVKSEKRHGGEAHGDREEAKPKSIFGRFHAGFERGFERFRQGYLGLLKGVLAHRLRTFAGLGAVLLAGGTLFTFVGQDYFPKIDAGQMQLHVRPRSGLRIEDAQRFFAQVGDTIREVVPENERELILDNIGLPQNNYNLAFSDGSTVAYNDGQILVALKEKHRPTAEYQRTLRKLLRERFPEATFYFQPADIITQILNFGLPAAINVQVVGRDVANNKRVAQRLVRKIRAVRGAADVHIQQILDAPSLRLDVDRVRAQQVGLTAGQVANNVNISLSSSFQVQPNFWPDPKSGIPYQVAVQTPEYQVGTIDELNNTPIALAGPVADELSGTQLAQSGRVQDGPGATLLSNVATLSRRAEQTVITHSNTQPVYDIYADVQDRDLGSVERDIGKIVAEETKALKPGNRIVLRGQIESKNTAFLRIALGLGAALLFVYGLMVVNFQDWGDPFVVLLALPVAFCGIVAALFVTGTSLSIPSLMGAIMSVGVASANSILLVTFAREHREATGCSALEAAIEAGATRLRPVLMTAGAMFVGLIPMSLGLGDGSEQNAALARAVMGGISFGTASTLFLVPFFYALLRARAPKPVEDYR